MTRDNIFYTICGFLLGLTLGALVIGPKVAKSKLVGSPAAAEESAPAPAGADPASAAAPANAPFAGAAQGGAGMEQMNAIRQQLQTLKDTVARDPKNFDALAQLGNMYMDAAKSDQAVEYYERALAVHEDANVRTDLGICYKNANQLDKALAAFAQAASEAPDQWQPKFNQAVVLVELKRFPEARKLATELSAARPTDPEVQRLQQALLTAK